MDKMEIIEWLILLMAIAAMASTYIILTFIDSLIHQILYQYGLEFSYEWANPYWIYQKTIQALLLLTTIAIIASAALTRYKKKKLKIGTDEELLLLREKIRGIRGRKSRTTGFVLLFVSVAFLILAYSTRYIVFEVTSIISLFLGLIFVFTVFEPSIKGRVADSVASSPLTLLGGFLKHLKLDNKAIHIPPIQGLASGRIFIQTSGKGSPPTLKDIPNEDDVVISNKGVFLPSIGGDLLRLYEEEMGEIQEMDLVSLIQWLPKVLVERLRMVDDMEIVRDEEKINVKLKTPAFKSLCQNVKDKEICKFMGCPVCSSIADAVAKVTSRLVYYVKCNYDPTTNETSVLYRLGPKLGEK